MIDLVIRASRPNLSDNSLKTYLISLKKLNGGKPISDLKFLEDYDGVVNFLSSKADTTKKNYLNAVIIALQALKGSPELIAKYEQLRDKYNQAYTDVMHAGQTVRFN